MGLSRFFAELPRINQRNDTTLEPVTAPFTAGTVTKNRRGLLARDFISFVSTKSIKGETMKLPISIVAARMNTTPLNVLMHIKRGMLDGVEEDGIWMIDCQSLEALMAKTGGSKAEDVCASGCVKKHACSGGCS
jgi:hypothetical protein